MEYVECVKCEYNHCSVEHIEIDLSGNDSSRPPIREFNRTIYSSNKQTNRTEGESCGEEFQFRVQVTFGDVASGNRLISQVSYEELAAQDGVDRDDSHLEGNTA